MSGRLKVGSQGGMVPLEQKKAISQEKREIFNAFKKYSTENQESSFCLYLKTKKFSALDCTRDPASKKSPWDDKAFSQLSQFRGNFFRQCAEKIGDLVPEWIQEIGASPAKEFSHLNSLSDLVELKEACLSNELEKACDILEKLPENFSIYKAFSRVVHQMLDLSKQEEILEKLAERGLEGPLRWIQKDPNSCCYQLLESKIEKGELKEDFRTAEFFVKRFLPSFLRPFFLECRLSELEEALHFSERDLSNLAKGSLLRKYLEDVKVINKRGEFVLKNEPLEIRKSLVKALQFLSFFLEKEFQFERVFSSTEFCLPDEGFSLEKWEKRLQEVVYESFLDELKKQSENIRYEELLAISQENISTEQKIIQSKKLLKFDNPLKQYLRVQVPFTRMEEEFSTGILSRFELPLEWVREESFLDQWALKHDLEFLLISEVFSLAKKNQIEIGNPDILYNCSIHKDFQEIEKLVVIIGERDVKKALHQKIDSLYEGIRFLLDEKEESSDLSYFQKYALFKKKMKDLYQKAQDKIALLGLSPLYGTFAREAFLNDHSTMLIRIAGKTPAIPEPKVSQKAKSVRVSPVPLSKSSSQGLNSFEHSIDELKLPFEEDSRKSPEGIKASPISVDQVQRLEETSPKKSEEERLLQIFLTKPFEEKMEFLEKLRGSSFSTLKQFFRYVFACKNPDAVFSISEFLKRKMEETLDPLEKETYLSIVYSKERLFKYYKECMEYTSNWALEEKCSPLKRFFKSKGLIQNGEFVQDGSSLESLIKVKNYLVIFCYFLRRQAVALKLPIPPFSGVLSELDSISSEIAYKKFQKLLIAFQVQFSDVPVIQRLKQIGEDSEIRIEDKIEQSLALFQEEEKWTSISAEKKTFLQESLETISTYQENQAPDFSWPWRESGAETLFLKYCADFKVSWEDSLSWEENFLYQNSKMDWLVSHVKASGGNSKDPQKFSETIEDHLRTRNFNEMDSLIKTEFSKVLSQGASVFVREKLEPEVRSSKHEAEWILTSCFKDSLEVPRLDFLDSLEGNFYERKIILEKAFSSFYRKSKEALKQLNKPSWYLDFLDSAVATRNLPLLDWIFQEISYEQYKVSLQALSDKGFDVSLLIESKEAFEKLPVQVKINKARALLPANQTQVGRCLLSELQSFSPQMRAEFPKIEKLGKLYVEKKRGRFYQYLVQTNSVPVLWNPRELAQVETVLVEYIQKLGEQLDESSDQEELCFFLKEELENLSYFDLNHLDQICMAFEGREPPILSTFYKRNLIGSVLKFLSTHLEKCETREERSDFYSKWVEEFDLIDLPTQVLVLREFFRLKMNSFIYVLMRSQKINAKKAGFHLLKEQMDLSRGREKQASADGPLLFFSQIYLALNRNEFERLMNQMDLASAEYDNFVFWFENNSSELGLSLFLDKSQIFDRPDFSKVEWMRNFKHQLQFLKLCLIGNMRKFHISEERVDEVLYLTEIYAFDSVIMELGYERMVSQIGDEEIKKKCSVLYSKLQEGQLSLDEFERAISKIPGVEDGFLEKSIHEMLEPNKMSVLEEKETPFTRQFKKLGLVIDGPIPQDLTYWSSEFVEVLKEKIKRSKSLAPEKKVSIIGSLEEYLMAGFLNEISELSVFLIYLEAQDYLESIGVSFDLEWVRSEGERPLGLSEMLQRIEVLNLPLEQERVLKSILDGEEFFSRSEESLTKRVSLLLNSSFRDLLISKRWDESLTLSEKHKILEEVFSAIGEDLDQKVSQLERLNLGMHPLYKEKFIELAYLMQNVDSLDWLFKVISYQLYLSKVNSLPEGKESLLLLRDQLKRFSIDTQIRRTKEKLLEEGAPIDYQSLLNCFRINP